MPEASKNIDLDEQSVGLMRKLEREMGVILLAWYQQPAEYAKLSDAQIVKLQELEASLSVTIVAYKAPENKDKRR